MKRTFSVVGFMLLLLVLSGCGEEQVSAEQRLAFAVDFREQGNFDAAVNELKQLLQSDPANTQARWELGMTYLQIGEVASAEKELQRSLELGQPEASVVIPLARARITQGKFQEVLDSTKEVAGELASGDKALVKVMRGNAQLGLGNLDAAEKLYSEAQALEENEPEAELGKARLAYMRGRVDKAKNLLRATLEQNENFVAAWILLGDIEQYSANMQEADAAYGKALALNPSNVYVLANRALTRIAMNDLAGANADVGKAIILQQTQAQKEPLTIYARGRTKLARLDYTSASNDFEKVIELTPDYVPAYYFSAVTFYRLGSIERADQHIARFRAKAPQYPEGHRLFAAIKFAQGDYRSARETLENLLSYNPDDAWSLTLLGDIDAVEGNPAQSVNRYKKIVELHPDSELAHVNLGLGLMKTDPQEALRAFQEAAALKDASPQARMLAIASFMKLEEWDKAVSTAQDLVEADPKNWDAHTLLGGAYYGKGDVNKSRQALQRALKLRPGNPNAANNLARMEIRAGNISRGRELLEEILQHNPGEVTPVLALSAIDLQQGQAESAVARLEKALAEQPDQLPLRVALARINLRTGQPTKNLALIREADEVQAKSSLMLQLLGDSQFALGQFPAAAETYEKLVSLAPLSAPARYLLARAYAASNKLEQADKQLQRLSELDENHIAGHVLRARLLRLDKKPAQAQQILDSLDPSYAEAPEVLVEKAWLAMSKNDNAAAVSLFEQALKTAPSSDLVVQLGIAKWRAGDPMAARQLYTAWLADNPRDTQVLSHLANTELQLGRDEAAITAFSKLLESNPRNPVILNNLAWLSRKTDPKKALDYVQRALQEAPDWAPGLDTLGSIYLDQGKVQDAYKQFEQALLRSPDDPDIRYHLALASSRMGESEQAEQILQAILADPAARFESRPDAVKLLKAIR